MNFLQLARAVKRESGLSGGPPASATTASGDDSRVFEWVNWAWRDIALAHESWLFRRGEALGQVPAGTLVMVPEAAAPGFALADFAAWKPAADGYRPSAWRVADGQVSEHALAWLDYEAFRQRFLTGTHAPGALQYWSMAPGGELLVGPTPDAVHMVRAAYVKDVVDLVLDADEPALPARFHPLIGWRALREYGGFDAASEVYQRAEQNYSMGFSALAQSQLPRPGFGARPLA